MDGDGPQPSAVDLDRMGTSTKAMLGAQASSAALVGTFAAGAPSRSHARAYRCESTHSRA